MPIDEIRARLEAAGFLPQEAEGDLSGDSDESATEQEDDSSDHPHEFDSDHEDIAYRSPSSFTHDDDEEDA